MATESCLPSMNAPWSATINPCVCKPVGLPDANVDATARQEGVSQRRINYWRLWLFDAVLVSAGALFFLAAPYGSNEFFGKALTMALLPFIPVMVLVGGAGSTLFALTKVLIEKRSLNPLSSLVLLVGPALVFTLLLVLLGAGKSPGHRLAYLCLGNAPASASQVQITGYSTFLREEWLAVFNVDREDFQKLVARSKLEPVPDYDFRATLGHSALKETGAAQKISRSDNLICFRRVFNEHEEHERGRVYAAFDPVTATAVVFREYRD